MSDGLLTQAINNTQNAANAVLSSPDLPPSAAPVLDTARRFPVEIEPGLSSTRILIATTAAAAVNSLSEALTALNGVEGTPPAPIAALVREIVVSTMASCSEAMTAVEQSVAGTGAYLESVNAQSRTIAEVESDLDGQRVKLQSQIDSKRSEIDALNHKLKYLGILGIFGLAGGGVAIGLLEKARSELSGMTRDMQSVGTRLNSVNQARGAMNTLAESTRILSNTLLDLNNAFEFARADISNMLDNLEHSDVAAAKLFITATLAEMRELEAEAS